MTLAHAILFGKWDEAERLMRSLPDCDREREIAEVAWFARRAIEQQGEKD